MFYSFYPSLSLSLFCLLATGVPANSNAQVKWAQDGGRLSLLAELQAGPEYLKAEFNGGKTDHLIPRWEYFSGLQHQVKALLERGLSSSIQAKAHYQVKDCDDNILFYPWQLSVLLGISISFLLFYIFSLC